MRDHLARAEDEYVCAEFIDDTTRMFKERLRWATEIQRLRAEIAKRDEGWSGVWEEEQ